MKKFVCIVPDVYRLSVTFPGAWTGVVLVTGRENIIIDSGGSAGTVDSEIVPALNELGLSFNDIQWLVLTHIHGDHVGGCARIKELSSAIKIAVFHQSQERIRDPLAYSKAIRSRFPAHSPKAPAALRGVTPDLLLRDGDTIGSLRLIHTPGHDTDSCCYLHESSGTLITGDSLQLNGTHSQGCALLLNAENYEGSLRRLLQMRIQNIVCGHDYLPLGAQAIGEDASRRFLEACAAIHCHNDGFIRGMMAAGIADVDTIARALIHEVGGQVPGFLFLPLHTVTEYMKMGGPRYE